MLKLKYLIDNRPLARLLLENWEHDRSRPEVLDGFRISANAVYPFISGGAACFLRFSPAAEKPPEDIPAELAFLAYLRENGYPAAGTLPSKNGRALETADTPWGPYAAVVFKGVPGRRVDRLQLTDDLAFALGRTLGRLHGLSARYQPGTHRRRDWKDRLDRVHGVLLEHPDEAPALAEEAALRSRLSQLPAGPDIYGLVHYDFEPDNLFFDARDGAVHVIDFDDAVYHWYVMDIVQAAESLKEELPESARENAVRRFLDGYRSEKTIDEALLALGFVFKRYADLYCYARILRAVSGRPEHMPDWMPGLIAHLNALMNGKRQLFGTGMDS